MAMSAVALLNIVCEVMSALRAKSHRFEFLKGGYAWIAHFYPPNTHLAPLHSSLHTTHIPPSYFTSFYIMPPIRSIKTLREEIAEVQLRRSNRVHEQKLREKNKQLRTLRENINVTNEKNDRPEQEVATTKSTVNYLEPQAVSANMKLLDYPSQLSISCTYLSRSWSSS
jgi:hypothetical protein